MTSLTWARARSRPSPVSITKSARRRFSVSGTCRAIIAENRSSVMPARAMTRAFCTASGADTTATASTALSAPGLVEQGNVEHHQARARGARLGQEGGPRLLHERVHDGLEPAQHAGVVEDALAQEFPVDHAVLRGSGKRLLDRRDRGSRVERMHGRIGVEHPDAGLAEHGRRRRFAHADRTGQAEDHHCRSS